MGYVFTKWSMVLRSPLRPVTSLGRAPDYKRGGGGGSSYPNEGLEKIAGYITVSVLKTLFSSDDRVIGRRR